MTAEWGKSRSSRSRSRRRSREPRRSRLSRSRSTVGGARPGVSISSMGISVERSINSQMTFSSNSTCCMSGSVAMLLAIVDATRSGSAASIAMSKRSLSTSTGTLACVMIITPSPRASIKSFSTSICGPSGSSLRLAITSSKTPFSPTISSTSVSADAKAFCISHRRATQLDASRGTQCGGSIDSELGNRSIRAARS